jgi:hypothetical protein
VAIAGRLDYSRYGWLDRQLIRFIMMLTGGPTDPRTVVDFTSWEMVDDVAQRIAALNQHLGMPARQRSPENSNPNCAPARAAPVPSPSHEMHEQTA